jgi:hypothetical protein
MAKAPAQAAIVAARTGAFECSSSDGRYSSR